MVKLQKTVKGTYIISVPKNIKDALGWEEGQQFSLCPDQATGILRVVPLKGI